MVKREMNWPEFGKQNGKMDTSAPIKGENKVKNGYKNA